MRQPRGRPLGGRHRQGPAGLLAQADGGLLQASALPYTDEQMTPIEYTIDLPPSTATRADAWPPARSASAPPAAARARWTSTSSGLSRRRSPTCCACCPPDEKDLAGHRPPSRRRRTASSRCSAARDSGPSHAGLRHGRREDRVLDRRRGVAGLHGPFEFTGGKLGLRGTADGLLPYQGSLVLGR